MLARFLAGAVCAAGILTAVCTPAAAQSFFSSMFGSSTGRTVVSYPGSQKPGTIVINTRDRRLYLVLGNGQALSYGIGVGRVGFTWSGVTHVSAKREWPDWTPPAQMRQRRPDLPRHMAGGVANPLGARAMYLRLESIPHSRLERAGDDRPGSLFGLLPPDQRRCGRPL